MENRAVRLEKIALTSRAVALPPGATARIAIGAQVAQAHPSPVITARMRTEMVGGVNLTGAAVGRWHRIGSYRRGSFGMRGLVFTGDAMGFVGETLERCGLVRAVALGLDGLSCPL